MLQVETMLKLSNPAQSGTDLAVTAVTENGASGGTAATGVAARLGSAAADSYTIGDALAATATTQQTVTPTGVTTITGAAVAAGTSEETMALSIKDFNEFRLRVVDAINVLENKIRELTVLTDTLTC